MFYNRIAINILQLNSILHFKLIRNEQYNIIIQRILNIHFKFDKQIT